MGRRFRRGAVEEGAGVGAVLDGEADGFVDGLGMRLSRFGNCRRGGDGLDGVLGVGAGAGGGSGSLVAGGVKVGIGSGSTTPGTVGAGVGAGAGAGAGRLGVLGVTGVLESGSSGIL